MIRAFLRSKMPSVLMKVGADRMERELSVHIMGIFSLLLRSIVSALLERCLMIVILGLWERR